MPASVQSQQAGDSRFARRLRAEWTALLRLGLFVFALLAFSAEAPRAAQKTVYTEYQLKALFIFNFAKFTDWPPEAFPDSRMPFIFAIVGNDPFGNGLELVKNKQVKNRPFEVRRFKSIDQVGHCHILFIAPSEKSRIAELLSTIPKTGVLTVSETDRFLETGGMINFIVKNQTVAFEIQKKATEQAGLKLNTQLLKLADRVQN